MDPRDKKPAEASAVVIRHSEMPNLILHGKRSDSGQWSIPGGHVHTGEDIKSAAVREIKEETGLELNPDDLEYVGKKHYGDQEDKQLTVHLFLCKKPCDNKRMDHTGDKDQEFSELKFIDPLNHDDLYQPNGESILVTYLKGNLNKPEIKKSEELDKGKIINPPEIPKVTPQSEEYFAGVSYEGEDEPLKEAASKGKHLHLPLTQKNLKRIHLFHNETLDNHMDKESKDFAMKNPEIAKKYPIVIARHSDGSLHVTDGQHRFNQSIKDGKTHVKAFVFNVPKHYEDKIYAPNHISKYYPQFKKSEELDKDQGRIAFKKLNVPSRPDQEVRELTTPRQFEITSRHFANKYSPGKSTAQKKMDAAQLQYNIENDIGGTITNEEGKFSTPFMNTNLDFGSKKVDPNFIKEHEGFHHLMNTVREKYGHENAGNILNSLISHIHPEDVKSLENSLVQRNYKKKDHPLGQQLWNEEIINHVRDFVHFSGARKGFSEESGARIKNAWKKMQRAAKDINLPLSDEQPKKLAASEKSEELDKGSLQRRFKFDPKKDVSEQEAAHLRLWQTYGNDGHYGETVDDIEDVKSVREGLKPINPNAKKRGLSRLMSMTKIRFNPETKEREFLLHRGVSNDEHKNSVNVKNNLVQHNDKTSWMPDYDTAVKYGNPNYSTSGRIRDSKEKGKVISAWIGESKIHHMPKMYGAIGSPVSEGANEYQEENEIIVLPHKSILVNFKEIKNKLSQKNKILHEKLKSNYVRNVLKQNPKPKKLAASEKSEDADISRLTKANKPKKAKNLRRFYLNRKNDVNGVSGEGIVAVGVQFPNGKCVLNWVTDTPSFNFYNSINDIKDIHGHGDSTEIHFMDDLNKSEKEKKLQKAYENKRLKWKYLRKFPEHKLPFMFLKSRIK